MSEIETPQDGAGLEPRPYTLKTRRGPVDTLLYESLGAKAGALLAGGVGGGFDTPALGLYPRLGEELLRHHLSTLRVRYRHSTDLAEAVQDVLAGVDFLVEHGLERVALVGHSFGGAVMIDAGAQSPWVTTVVGLSPQSYGTEAVSELHPRSLLLVHGRSDAVLPPSCSLSIYERARGRKELELIPGAGHVLDEAAERVFTRVRDWLLRELRT
ncbi:alpha/beta hydrolase [Archangium minus]|uniref:Alpha/beta hydrolase n=1 Tax=Archangium minus TaxID=83450 RepID=A0ABY9WS23_9BACT|nr:alpha/beta hydrolase [Archangium violaceum]WNG43806.1 alpha/beta hydrolase [Archangium minus]